MPNIQNKRHKVHLSTLFLQSSSPPRLYEILPSFSSSCMDRAHSSVLHPRPSPFSKHACCFHVKCPTKCKLLASPFFVAATSAWRVQNAYALSTTPLWLLQVPSKAVHLLPLPLFEGFLPFCPQFHSSRWQWRVAMFVCCVLEDGLASSAIV